MPGIIIYQSIPKRLSRFTVGYEDILKLKGTIHFVRGRNAKTHTRKTLGDVNSAPQGDRN